MAESNKKGQGTQGKSGEPATGMGSMSSTGGTGGTGGTGVTHMAKEAAGTVSQTASNLASAAAEQAEHATHGVGSGMRSLAGTIRERAPGEGMLHTAAGKVADSLESGGRFLEQESLSDLADDVVGMVRRNPMLCMSACVGFGFVLGYLMTSSNRS